jgi:hypothetical protein
MMTVKVQCGCGQRYAFDVEPIGGRMPSGVACPVCGLDGTATANQIIGQTLGAQSPPVGAAAPMRIATAAAVPAPLAVPAATSRTVGQPQRQPEREWGPGGEGDTWKWWYYILAGICLGGYDIWYAYDKQSIKPLGGLFLAVFLIAVGVWDFQRKRKLRKG